MSRVISSPREGYFLLKLARGGPSVAACIVRIETDREPGEETNRMERSSFLAAFVNGQVTDLADVWERKGVEITAAEYIRIAARGPVAEPRKALSVRDAALPF